VGVALAVTKTGGSGGTMASASIESSAQQPGCDEVPTGVTTEDYWLRFNVPPGLMPDKQFDGRPAKLQVHRVRPVYANGRCRGVSTQAAVLIHGRTVPGPVLFDLREPATGGGELSVQEGLARAGIDTFAPSLLGYGRSTRFSLNDPGNASLRGYPPESPTSCPYPEGCDRTLVREINPLDQQGQRNPTLLWVNPLGEQRRAHSSNFRFARTDVWVRDIDQVINDAIERAQPTDKKVALVAYSVGGQFVGRTLYAGNPLGGQQLEPRSRIIDKVSRVVFLNSVFGGQTEDQELGLPTFPLTLDDKSGSDVAWRMPTVDREAACTGHVIPGTQEQLWKQTLEHDTLGSQWGGDDPTNPTGLNRVPTFSGYGWNPTVAQTLSTPTLVIQGLDDTRLQAFGGPVATSSGIFNNVPVTNKVLVQVQCASHALQWEGCAQTTPIPARCTPPSGTPYGGTPGAPWAGPHSTLKAALIEWIKSGTFDGAANGHFIVDESGVARAVP
jgi:pimeloyl-ACP methyl ester carboxylesterase